jgi:hypothetical protein
MIVPDAYAFGQWRQWFEATRHGSQRLAETTNSPGS